MPTDDHVLAARLYTIVVAYDHEAQPVDVDEAAAELERLAGEVERLREALHDARVWLLLPTEDRDTPFDEAMDCIDAALFRPQAGPPREADAGSEVNPPYCLCRIVNGELWTAVLCPKHGPGETPDPPPGSGCPFTGTLVPGDAWCIDPACPVHGITEGCTCALPLSRGGRPSPCPEHGR